MNEPTGQADIVCQNVSVTMIRHDLGSLPAFDLPAGYRLRMYRAGDEVAWVRIHEEADRYNEASLELYRREFGEDLEALEQRQYYLVWEEQSPVGTATAWYDEDYHGAESGRVHWVAILPSHQGAGLAKPLLAAVCRRLRKLGHERAYLSTSTARIPAINLYLKFGFVPDIHDAEGREAWRKLRPQVKEQFRSVLPE